MTLTTCQTTTVAETSAADKYTCEMTPSRLPIESKPAEPSSAGQADADESKTLPNEPAPSVPPPIESKPTESLSADQATSVEPKAHPNEPAPSARPRTFDHPDVSVPKSEEIECQTWDVVLSKRDGATKFGFAYVNYRDIFLKRLGGPAQHMLALVAAPELLIVKRVAKDALLDEWNCGNPSLQVCVSDRVAQVNERDTIDGMESALLCDEIRLRMVRYPERFHVDLVKREAVSKWGFMFGKSQGGLRIADLSSDGLLREYN